MDKQRLIPDRRVSGSKDHTLKSDRIMLPRAWPVIKVRPSWPRTGAKGRISQSLCVTYRMPLYGPLHREAQRYFVARTFRPEIAQGPLNGPNIPAACLLL